MMLPALIVALVLLVSILLLALCSRSGEARGSRTAREFLERSLEDLDLAREEQRRLSSCLEESGVRMKEIENLATIGRLAVGVCHDINNPLAYVCSNLELIEEALETLAEGPRLILDPTRPRETLMAWSSSDDVEMALEDAPSALRDAIEGCRRIRDLAAGMNSMARREVHQVPSSLSMVAADAVRIAGAGLPGVRIRTHLEDSLPVLCAPGEMVRVIINLIINGGQACGPSGVVTVAGWSEGDEAVLEVADNGPGIPVEMRSKIFEPFFTTKPVGEGTGLGLAISHDIVGRHGGELRLRSTAGEGTRFQLRLALDGSGVKEEAALLLHEWKSARVMEEGLVA